MDLRQQIEAAIEEAMIPGSYGRIDTEKLTELLVEIFGG